MVLRYHCVGLLIHLQKYGIPCIHWEDIVRYAVINGQFDTLVFMTSLHQFQFRTTDGHVMKEPW